MTDVELQAALSSYFNMRLRFSNGARIVLVSKEHITCTRILQLLLSIYTCLHSHFHKVYYFNLHVFFSLSFEKKRELMHARADRQTYSRPNACVLCRLIKRGRKHILAGILKVYALKPSTHEQLKHPSFAQFLDPHEVNLSGFAQKINLLMCIRLKSPDIYQPC